MPRKEIGRSHLVAYTLIKKPGFKDRKASVLYVIDDITGEPKAMMPLVEYLLDYGRTRSLSWQKEVCRATGLFVDFLKANAQHFQLCEDKPQVLAAFAEALTSGTIESDGNDLSGLYWTPKKIARSTAILNSLTGFSDWLVNRYDTTAINPWRQASVAEQIAYWRRFDKRRSHALLMHTYDKDDAIARSKLARSVRVLRKTTSGDSGPVKTFPNNRIWDLLNKGFVVHGKENAKNSYDRLNIRDILITILLHGGGLRASEPFHIFVSDIAVDPRNHKSALVRVYHPEQGAAPDDYIDPISGKHIDADREEYLRVKWAMQPRSLVAGRFHAGWKDLHLTDQNLKYAMVHWFPSFWGEIFMALFKVYISKVRPRHCSHPYLFVSKKDDVAGDPYTVASYFQSHARAVKRIGLKAGKDFGTTPHGHRHSYAQIMTDEGVANEVIRHALHHKSIDSQNTYKEPTPEKMNSALNEASHRLQCKSEPDAFLKKVD